MPRSTPPAAVSPSVYWLSGVLFLFAVVFAFQPFQFFSPLPAAVVVPPWATDPTPVRQPSVGPSTIRRSSRIAAVTVTRLFRRRRNDRYPDAACGNRVGTRINTRCFNCHHPTNRDVFVDDHGDEIPWDQPQLLCAKCHGPVYRDWQHGSHGRTNGYWDHTQGDADAAQVHRVPRPTPSAVSSDAAGTRRPTRCGWGGRIRTRRHGDHDPLRLHGARRVLAGSRSAREEGH